MMDPSLSERVELIALGALLAGAKLDIPGDWFHGQHAGKIQAWLNKGKDPEKDKILYNALGSFLGLEGPFMGLESIKESILATEAHLCLSQAEELMGRRRFHPDPDKPDEQERKVQEVIRKLTQFTNYRKRCKDDRKRSESGGGTRAIAKEPSKAGAPAGQKEHVQGGATGGPAPASAKPAIASGV